MKVYLALWFTPLALAILPAAVRADKLDVRLAEEMASIKKHLDDKGYKNVGVLRFQVQKGKNAPKLDNAPYNGNLPTRVENLLIIYGNPVEAKAMGVTRDAGLAASKAKIGNWLTDEKERKKLFDVEYPLAWGKKKVTVDAFLTGLVQLSADAKKTTYSISCFDKNDLEPKVIRRFTLDTDRDILRDLGGSFVLSRKVRNDLVTKRKTQDVDKGAIDSFQDEGGGGALDDVRPEKDKDKKDKDKNGGNDDKPKRKPRETTAIPDDVAGIEVSVLVDKKIVELQQGKDDGAPWQLTSPTPGQAVAVRLKNTTTKSLGVVFKVNGISTFDGQNTSPDKCQKWIVRPGKFILLRGYYAPNGEELSLQPFKILVGEEAKEVGTQFGDKAGLLEFDVFAEGAEEREKGGGDEEAALEVSAKGMPPSKEKLARETYKSLRTALLKSAKLKADTSVAKRTLFVPDKDAIEGGKLKVVNFPSHFVGRLAVKVVPGSE